MTKSLPWPPIVRLPNNPDAIDIGALHRERQLATWRRIHPKEIVNPAWKKETGK